MTENPDRQIRQKFYLKDKDFNEKIKLQMQEQENLLKDYFKEYKKPVQDDPSIMKRQNNENRTMVAKEALAPFRVFRNFYDQYWNLDCETPQQRYILNLCKQNTKKQILHGLIGSLAITSITSFALRMTVKPKIHFIGFLVGVSSGLLYGIINSSQFSLQKFEQLGDKYSLGRSTLMEIERFRMDKPK